MDVTIQIIGIEGSAPSSPGKHLEADVVGVYPLINAPASPNSRLVFIHVTGVPVPDVGGLKFLLSSSDTYRHIWHFDKSQASEQGLSVLQVNRSITIDWPRAKQLLKNKSTGQYLTDEDIA